MKKAIILLNGVSLPYPVIDAAMAWAKEHSAALKGIIVYSDQRNAEDYAFPSDIEEVQNEVSENEAEMDLQQLIRRNAKYIQKQGTHMNVGIEDIVLQDPGKDALADILQEASVIFTDPALFSGKRTYAQMIWSMEDIRKLTDAEIMEIVPQS